MLFFNTTRLDCLQFILFVQAYMDSEIRAIMAQYMPLDSQGEVPNHVHGDRLDRL